MVELIKLCDIEELTHTFTAVNWPHLLHHQYRVRHTFFAEILIHDSHKFQTCLILLTNRHILVLDSKKLDHIADDFKRAKQTPATDRRLNAYSISQL